MLMLSLDDAVDVVMHLFNDVVNDDDEEFIRSELEQKCWIPPETDRAAKHLKDLIFDINLIEISSQIKSDNLRRWCSTIQAEMTMAMARMSCCKEE